MENIFNVKIKIIVELRRKMGYSQEKMGELLMTERSNYGKIERGETMLTLQMAYKIAWILKCKPEDFINLPTASNQITDNTFTKCTINSLDGYATTNRSDSPEVEKAIRLLEEAMQLLRANSNY